MPTKTISVIRDLIREEIGSDANEIDLDAPYDWEAIYPSDWSSDQKRRAIQAVARLRSRYLVRSDN